MTEKENEAHNTQDQARDWVSPRRQKQGNKKDKPAVEKNCQTQNPQNRQGKKGTR